MKVLFLDQFGDLGGAQRCLLDLLPEFSARGWQAIVAAPPGPLLDCASDQGALVEPLELPDLRSGRKSARDWLQFAAQTPRIAQSISELAQKYRPHVVYANGPRLIPPLTWANPNAACLFHSHHFLEQSGAKKAVSLGLKRLDAEVIACCRFVADQWAGSRVTTIYNGVEGGDYQPRTRIGAIRIGVIGRIGPEKGQAIFVEAAKLLAASRENLEFAVIGGPLLGGVEAAEYCARLQDQAPPSMEFTGWLDNPAAYLAKLHLLVVPSIGAEATTRVVPEAWAAGVPVVASRMGGLAEIIDDGVNGFLVEPGSPQALARRIEEALELEPRQREVVTLAARRAFEARFTRDGYARQVADLLARVVQSPNQKSR